MPAWDVVTRLIVYLPVMPYNNVERILDDDGGHYNSPYVNVSGYSGGSLQWGVVSQAEGVSPYKSFGFNA